MSWFGDGAVSSSRSVNLTRSCAEPGSLPLIGEVDPLRCCRAPGASTYIRQLRDGLPQSCMHSADDRGDGFTLFAGARDANRILDYPSPRLWSLFRFQSSGKLVDPKWGRVAVRLRR